MADVQPLRALHYDLATAGPLDRLTAPPYDVIDAGAARASSSRAARTTSSRSTSPQGEDPYGHAAELLEQWQMEGILVRDAEPALWALTQTYRAPDGGERTRHGFFCQVRHHRLRPRPDPPARAHAPRRQGGPPAS